MSRPRFAEKILMPGNLWTEHIMPSSWGANWPFDDGSHLQAWSSEPRVRDRNRLVQTLGNLTLISDGLNISSSNASFAEKKEKYAEHAALFLTKNVAAKESWSEASILERGGQLADLAVKIWAAPGSPL